MPTKNDRESELSNRYKSFSILAAFLAFIGLVISAYSLNHHLEVQKTGFSNAACNISDTVNCDAAASSKFSEVLGIPLPVWGGGYFLGLLLIAIVGLFVKPANAAYFIVYGALSFAGACSSVILAVVSIFYLGSICPSCVLIYLVCALQFVLAFWFRRHAKNFKITAQLVPPGLIAITAILSAALSFNATASKLGSTSKPSPDIELTTANGSKNLSAVFHEIPISTSAFSGLGEDYRLGHDEAKVKLVVFSDFQCPACKNMDDNLKEIEREFGERILIVFKNYPLDPLCNSGIPRPMHVYACKSATLARCAGRHKRFWQFHDRVFLNQQTLDETKLELWALEVGVSREQVGSCLDSSSILEKIKDDVDLGNKLGVNSTPSVYINGYKFVGSGLLALRAEVERLLK